MEIKTLQVGPIGTNCYLLCDTGAGVCAVIDPGAEASRVAAAVQESGCTPAPSSSPTATMTTPAPWPSCGRCGPRCRCT